MEYDVRPGFWGAKKGRVQLLQWLDIPKKNLDILKNDSSFDSFYRISESNPLAFLSHSVISVHLWTFLYPLVIYIT